MNKPQPDSKTKLLDATLGLVRQKGYSATRVEDVCAAAGVTKGSFFHHFNSKEDLALTAVAHWDANTSSFFASAPYHQPADPLERLLAYIDFRKAILTGGLADYTCFAGTIVQENYQTHVDLSAACARNITDHAKSLEDDIRKALKKYGVKGSWTATSLALHIQAVIQGGFVLAKATGTSDVARETLDHLRRYLELLFGQKAARVEK